MANVMLLKLLGVMALCRAGNSFCLSLRATQHVLTAARKLVMASSSPDDTVPAKRSYGRQPLKSSSSSSNSNNARRDGRLPHSAGRANAVQKSKALTARIGELGRQGRWQDVIPALETAESNGQK
eukprot:19037-Heterococcus_DN1.PRE.1